MGAYFDCRVHPGQLSKDELIKRFQQDQVVGGFEDGHSCYGTIAMLEGVTVSNKVCASYEEACNWIQNQHEKWEPALAVRFADKTSDNGFKWLVGGWCAS
jgi:hypothetical protein